MDTEASVEKIYQKKTQLEHILLRPDSYVGSIESTNAQLWILNEGDDKFTLKNIEYVPGLYKIFDEILVNAADNYQRDHSMDEIRVTIDKSKNTISIWNNGKGIPVQIHKEYNIYVPELIFGHLLTSSNYDDTKKKVTGGRNGYGAKLTNIFSKKFIVETADSKNKKRFKMTWENNMSQCSPPEIKEYNEEDFTCITFKPDLKRFGLKELDDDMIALMRKRVYDLAGVISSTVKVYLNGKKVPIKGFSSYVDMYLKNSESNESIKLIDKGGKGGRWNLIISQSEGQFQQVSFVNSICTSRGGTHVNYVTEQIVEKILETIKKKHKDLNHLKPFQIKNHLWIFLNTLIENPAFDSQTKETLTSKPTQFGSKYELSEKFLKEIIKSGIVENIVMQAQAKQHAKMAKTLQATKKSRLLGIPKLEDANEAGTRTAEYCTLILTEGDSAKQLAMAGIEVVGRDRYGVFPLKGKLLNVRDASIKQITENQEIQNIIKILGLQVNKKYENVKQLRYGSIMIMADQDQDGSHIKGLIINFLHHFWPSLVRQTGFLKEFVTPLIKAKKGNETKSFFTVNDFKSWAQTVDIKKWKVKYYKGLGTSTDKEGKEYFQNISKHQINFKYRDHEDDEAIDLAFNKKKADDRKQWLTTYDPEVGVDHNQKTLRYYDFVHKELIQFSYYDNLRSIPSLCDGFKPGQRKILYACFKRNLKAEIKVAQLVGYVAEHSAYHHGEASLAQTIVGMAQNFVGANNINLLMPIGQFGSRYMGGKEAASSRYIYTNLSKLARCIFNEHDDHLYKYVEDDGQVVEPEWYLPIIPMILVNGADGIGTGWSTSVPCYNPRDIVENLIRKLKGGEFDNMKPWFRGYKGTIEPTGKGGYTVVGKYEILDENTLRIYELPIRKWTREYKNFLENLLNPEEGDPEIEDIKEYHTNNSVDFVIRLPPGKLDSIIKGEGIEKKFKLIGSISATNMVLFDPHGKLKKYNDIKEIMEEYFEFRLQFYQKRKDYLVSKLLRELEILENKKRFVLAVIADDIKLRNSKKSDILRELAAKGYKMMKDITKIKSTKLAQEALSPQENPEESTESDQEADIEAKEYNYLLSLPIWSLTYEKVEELKKEYTKKSLELDALLNTTIQDMYEKDLQEFLTLYTEFEEKEEAENNSIRKTPTKAMLLNPKLSQSSSNNKKKPKKKTKTVRSDSDEDNDFDSEDEYSDEEFFVGKKKQKETKEAKEPKEKKKEVKKLKKSTSITVNEEDSEKEKPSFSRFLSQPTVLNKKTPSPKKRLTKKAKEETPEKEEKDANNLMHIESKEETKAPTPESSENKKPKEKEDPLNNSILRYLVKKPVMKEDLPVVTQKSIIDADDYDPLLQMKPLSLTERIKMRENSGDIETFNQMYETVKKSNSRSLSDYISSQESVNSKRKSDYNISKKKVKKVKTDEDEDSVQEVEEIEINMNKVSSVEDSDNNNAKIQSNSEENSVHLRPRRSTNRKILIISDDEDEKMQNEDDDFIISIDT